jgi:nucleoside-diphosphate-sugar epimerase
MEYVHPADVGLAFANLLDAPQAWGRVLLIGGGERCRIRQRDLFDAVFTAAGVGPLPPAAFGDAPYYTDWMDTAQSQGLLGYQRHTFEDFRREALEALRFKRPFIRALRPLVRHYLLSHSRPWRGRHG